MIYLNKNGEVCSKLDLEDKSCLNLNNIYFIELPDGAKLPDWDVTSNIKLYKSLY